jgi:hypothetical protein
MTWDNFNRRLPALPPIGVRPIDVLEAAFIRSCTTAEWEAALAAKYGDDWQDEPTQRDIQLAGDAA